MSFQRHTKMKEPSISEFIDIKSKSTPVAKVAPELKQNAEGIGEIKKTCAILGCEDFKNLNNDYFFRFPEEPHFRQIWTDLTGRNNWTPTDYSYICIQHFSLDSFTDDDEKFVLKSDAVPSQKLPNHVFEVEYIDEETLDNEDEKQHEGKDFEENEGVDEGRDFDEMEENNQVDMEMEYSIQDKKLAINGDDPFDLLLSNSVPGREDTKVKPAKELKEDKKFEEKPSEEKLLKLFTEVQRLQKTAITLKEKLKSNVNIQNSYKKRLQKVQELIEMKRNVLNEKRKRKSRILLTIQDKIKEDQKGLVLAMPMKHTDDLKNFSLSIYKYSPQAYIYIRNSLRTMLPSTDVLDSWINAGYQPKNVLLNNNMIKILTDQTDKELSCRIMLG